MEEVNFNFYTVDLADVWEFEKSRLLQDESHSIIASQLRVACECIILKKGMKTLSYGDYLNGDDHFKKYYDERLERFLQAKTEVDRYRLGYFFSEENCYPYNQTISINREDLEFELFFILKINQYQHRLTSLSSFCAYQVAENFDDNTAAFCEFVDLLLKQYHSIVHYTVAETLVLWTTKEHYHQTKRETPIRSNKQTVKFISDSGFNSYSLKAWTKNKDCFVLHADEILRILSDLKSNSFIHESTKFEQLKYLFQNSIRSKENPILWVGSNKELQWFIKVLTYDLNLVEDVKNDKWVIAINCFRKHDGAKYDVDALSKASGNNLEREALLKEILSKLPRS